MVIIPVSSALFPAYTNIEPAIMDIIDCKD
jgi:hypothetical protein